MTLCRYGLHPLHGSIRRFRLGTTADTAAVTTSYTTAIMDMSGGYNVGDTVSTSPLTTSMATPSTSTTS